MLTLDKLGEMNGWWKIGTVRKQLAPPFRRKLFFETRKYVKLRQITAIVGLRRTGKTTLFFQLIEDLIKSGVNSSSILYFSFDERVEELRELINLYQENILKKDIGGKKIYVFLDEIQKLKDWQNKIKIYYDLYPNIKFFVSGSASLNILVDAKESLAGRIFYFNLGVLSFAEFLQLRGKDIKKIKENVDLWKHELRVELNDFLLKPFPEIINANDEIAKKYIKESVIEKAIFRDLSSLFEIKDIELIEKLIYILASNPGMIVNLDDLSKDLGRSRQVISNYLYYLQHCFILNALRNFRGSFKASSRKLKRYYLSHPCLALALASPEQGKTMENLVQFAIKADHFWREQNKEVDFIVTEDKKITPIEVKYAAKVRMKDVKNLVKFMQEHKIKKGIVITEDFDAVQRHKNKIIKFVPMWKWLLT